MRLARHTASSRSADRRALFVVFVLAAAARVTVAVLWPVETSDTEIYERVAENIVQNGCVSLSQPDSGTCVPHWGGNQLPGYPAFLAAVWLIAGRSDAAVVLVQALVQAVAVTWCATCIGRALYSRSAFLLSGAILALSPLTVPWSRYLLTDSLSVSLNLLVFAELIHGFRSGRLRLLPLSFFAAAAIFLRIDNVLLVLPMLIIGMAVYPGASVLRPSATVAVLVALPLAAWWLRCVTLGLTALPAVATMPDGSPAPAGYIAWGNGWTLDQYEYPLWNYAIYKYNYPAIRIPDRAYDDAAERRIVEALLAELRQLKGEPVPARIDEAFAALSAAKMEAHPLRQLVLRPLLRAALMWVNPRNSAGWPVSLGDGAAGQGMVGLALANPGAALVKLGTAAFRAALPIVALGLLLACWRRRRMTASVLSATLVYAVAQTALHVGFVLVESRYLLAGTTGLEVAVCLGIATLLLQRRKE